MVITTTTSSSLLMAFEVRSGRVGNNCDHKGEVYCKAVCSVDRDPDDIDAAILAPFFLYDDKLVVSYIKNID